MRYAAFGSVIFGTMRPEDLLPALAWELDYQLKRQSRSFKRAGFRKLINRARRVDPESRAGADVLDELFDALEEFAPPYARFGAAEGEGADTGYWLSDMEDFDGLRVDDLSEVPADYEGEVLHVNDHGNMTLYAAGARGKLREVWAIV